jgi:hypothetical protein
MIGKTISRYCILHKPGRGGMGGVYRVGHTNLGWQVPIKVLPDLFHGCPHLLGRELAVKVLAGQTAKAVSSNACRV